MHNILINIDVPDIEAAEGFYCHAFDLKVGRRFDKDFVELLGLPSPIYLLKKASGTPVNPQGEQNRDYSRHWTPVHLDIVVNDIESATEQVLEAGAIQESPIKQQKYGKLAMFADPFGHGFCLIQFTGRGYDELL